MANPQPDKFIRLGMELYEAIMRFDFSKRQRNILDLIIRFSYGCGKKTALLRPSDFQQCGVGKNHIKKELETLAKAKVIFIDGEVIQLNKNYEEWAIKVVPGFDQKKWMEILKRNLVVPDSGTEVPKTGTDKVPETGTKVPETGTGVPKTGTENMFGSQNGNSGVPEMGTSTPSKPSSDAGFEPPIDNKDINNNGFNNNNNVPSFDFENEQLTEREKLEKEIEDYYQLKRGRYGFPVSGVDIELIKKAVDKFTREEIFDGINYAFTQSSNINSFEYCLKAIQTRKEQRMKWNQLKNARRNQNENISRNNASNSWPTEQVSKGKWDHFVISGSE